ncbi:MAG: hypothetical protein WD575_03835 [Nitriliruptoraceae bacterium]
MNDVHARRRRLVWRLFLAGPAVGVVVTAGLAFAGSDGRFGFTSLVLFTTFGAVVAAVVAGVLAIVDEARRETLPRDRIAQVLGLLVLAVSGLVVLFALAGA